MNKISQETIRHAKHFRKVVIWGLRQWHSHRFIHGFFETFKYLGIPVVVHCELFNNSSSDNGTL